MLVKSEMTKGVEFIGPNASVKVAAEKMKNLNIGVLPVCENNNLIGVITDRDITIRLTAKAKDPNTTKVNEIMSSNVEWCFEDDEIEKIAMVMEAKQIRRLPVLNHSKKLVGILSLSDIAVKGSKSVACEILEKVSEQV